MSKVQIYFPSSPLRPIVQRYDFAVASKEELGALRMYPGFINGFIFSFTDNKPIQIKSKLHDFEPLPADNLIPPLGISAENHFVGYIETIRVVFQPGFLFHLYHIPMNECKNVVIELGYVFDKELAYLREKLAELDTIEKKIECIESYLIGKITFHPSKRKRYDHLHSLLLKKGYKMKIAELASDLGESARNLNRVLNKEVGFSTKEFMRIHRFNRILKQLIHINTYGSLAELAYSFDFYDQAHFNREFKMLTGQSPYAYIRANAQKKFIMEISDEEMYHNRIVEETN